ncbi:MAG: tyrosyl-tRNA synthetase, tyrosyl-tRNA synthetase [Candidatus Parcubacteria bacterium]|jgi:tyrosyl-tRNA synthetase
MFGLKKAPVVSTDERQITEILTRGVEDTFVRASLEQKLRSGKQLRVKLGVDPTSAHIHLGRASVLRKLRDFQKLGHKAVFIVGDFTALIGDPSDKLEKRPMLTEADITRNLTSYKEQVGKIIDLSQAEFHYNSTWLAKLSFKEVAQLAESFSVSQMTARRNFKERLDRGDEVSLREFLYPIMQGYDSVVVNADVELGGFDQLFNVKAGRAIQKHFGKPEQDVLTVEMLEGTDGRKMSSSWGNVIAITDTPNDMYGKTMAVRDELIGKYFKLCTDVSLAELAIIEQKIAGGENPKESKMRLAREIVTLYHGAAAAVAAEANFEQAFTKGGVPEDVPVITASVGTMLCDVLVDEQVVSSKTDFKRLVKEGAITVVDGDKVVDIAATVTAGVYRVGKKRFVKIQIK